MVGEMLVMRIFTTPEKADRRAFRIDTGKGATIDVLIAFQQACDCGVRADECLI